jgi:4-amino-4-deoxy-L-arabinose transferase-like glycosyltransferase
LAILLLAFAVRIGGLTVQSLWRDEVDALRFSQAPLSTMIANFTRPGWNGPLYYVLLRAWVAAAGQSAFALRYFSLLFGVLAVACIYRLARVWFAAPIPALSALLLATSPYMVWYGQETKMYAVLTVLAMATLYAYVQALKGGHWVSWALVLILTWFSIGVHIMAGLLIPLMIALFFVWWPLARVQWRQALLALAGLIAPAFVALPWVWPTLARGGDIGHRFVSLLGMARVMAHAFSRGILPAGALVPIGLFLLALLAGTLLWTDRGPLSLLLGKVHGRDHARERREEGQISDVLALWTWILVPIVGLYLISLRLPMFVDRYLIWVGPAFYMLVARGLDQIRRRSMAVVAVCLVAMLWFNGQGIVQQGATPIKSDFQAAAAYVQAHRQPGELVIFHIAYVRYTFEYYYGDAAPWAEGIPADASTTAETVDALMRERTAGHDVVWLVLSEPEMWDPRGMTVAWLEAHAWIDQRADFQRVSVIRYVLRDS